MIGWHIILGRNYSVPLLRGVSSLVLKLLCFMYGFSSATPEHIANLGPLLSPAPRVQ